MKQLRYIINSYKSIIKDDNSITHSYQPVTKVDNSMTH
jgi:hypothetical protein